MAKKAVRNQTPANPALRQSKPVKKVNQSFPTIASSNALSAASSYVDNTIVNRVMRSRAYNKASNKNYAPARTFTQSYYKMTYPGDAPRDEFGKIKSTPNKAGPWEGVGAAKTNDDKAIHDFDGLSPAQLGERNVEKAKAIQAGINQRRRSDNLAEKRIETVKTQREKAYANKWSRSDALDQRAANLGLLGTAAQDKLSSNAENKLGSSNKTSLDGSRVEGNTSNTSIKAISNPTFVDVIRAQSGLPAISPQNRKANQQQHAGSKGSGVSINSERSENLGNSALGTPGSYGTNGRYSSGTNRQGRPTGGVGLDSYGREKNRFGGFTRDVIGREAADGGTRVICTELERQGLMEAELLQTDIVFTQRHIAMKTVQGYHLWAVPYVRLMKKSTIVTRLVKPFANWRAEEIAFQMGTRTRPHYRGKAVRYIGEPVCWLLGWMMTLQRPIHNVLQYTHDLFRGFGGRLRRFVDLF